MMRAMLLLALLAVNAAAGCSAGAGERKLDLPAGFPADVPLPERATLRASQDLGKQGLNLVFETGGDAADEVAARKLSMGAAGWRLVAEAALDNGVFLSYRKEGRAVAVGVSRSGGVTVVSLTYAAVPAGGAEGDGG